MFEVERVVPNALDRGLVPIRRYSRRVSGRGTSRSTGRPHESGSEIFSEERNSVFAEPMEWAGALKVAPTFLSVQGENQTG
jgi:hypothetical protein